MECFHKFIYLLLAWQKGHYCLALQLLVRWVRPDISVHFTMPVIDTKWLSDLLRAAARLIHCPISSAYHVVATNNVCRTN